MEITSTHSARGGFLYNFSTLVSVGKSDINWHKLLLTEISGLGETASQSIHHFFAGFTSVIWGVFQTWDWNLTVKIWDLVPKDLGFDTWNLIWHHCWKQNGKLWSGLDLSGGLGGSTPQYGWLTPLAKVSKTHWGGRKWTPQGHKMLDNSL